MGLRAGSKGLVVGLAVRGQKESGEAAAVHKGLRSSGRTAQMLRDKAEQCGFTKIQRYRRRGPAYVTVVDSVLSCASLQCPTHFTDGGIEAQKSPVSVHSQLGCSEWYIMDCGPQCLALGCRDAGPVLQDWYKCGKEDRPVPCCFWSGGAGGCWGRVKETIAESRQHFGRTPSSWRMGWVPADGLTLKHKVKVLILVSRKTVTGDPIRKNQIKP